MTFLIEERGMLFEYDTNKKEDIDAFFDGAVNENVFAGSIMSTVTSTTRGFKK